MEKNIFCAFIALTFTLTSFGQNLTYTTTVNSTSGQNYSVNIELILTDIVPAQSTCNWGYNYDVAYDYNIQLVGNNAPTSLYSIAGSLTCGSNQGIYFNLPNTGGSGNSVTQGNPWNNNSDCATATVESLLCTSIDLEIEGPGISNQTITLEPSNNNGGSSDWVASGNMADSTYFIGTKNSMPLKMKTNNLERFRITEEGKIGIGVEDPEKTLDIEGDVRLTGDLIFRGYEDLQDSIDRFMMIDKYGKTQPKSINGIRKAMYKIDCFQTTDNPVDIAVVGLTLPSWANRIADDKQILYTGVSCPTWVGIGTNLPQSTLDVRGDGSFTAGLSVGKNYQDQNAGLYIENRESNGHYAFEYLLLARDSEGKKMLQLDKNGLLRAREIKVDLASWPDYVFQKDYELMPLNKVKAFIAQNGHLPNVPSAEEIESDGVNLGKTAKLTMEKVEELTLYLIQQQEQLDEHKELLKQQQELIEAQQQLFKKQQQEIESLKVK